MKNAANNPAVKGIILIAVIILLIGVLTKVRNAAGETLADYAQKNPETALARSENSWRDALPAGREQDAQTQPSEEQERTAESQAPEPPEGRESAAESEPPENAAVQGADDESPMPEDADPALQFYAAELTPQQIERIRGISYPAEDADAKISLSELRYVHVLYADFDGNTAEGELICNEKIAGDLLEIFEELYRNDYRIEKIRLIDEYDGDDTASITDNNTSCFNYRVVEGTTRLSNHAYGLAIDINPFYNPYVHYVDGREVISPEGSEAYADRSASFPYKIDREDLCYRLFTEHGFTWGGEWNSVKDYQHFEKKP